MAIIEDAQSSRTAIVDSENRLKTFAVSQSEDKQTNIEGEYNSIYFEVTPDGAGDYFWYLQNTGTGDLTITDIRVSSSVVTQLNLHVVSGTPSYLVGTDTQVTNRNLGSNKSPAAISKYDDDITNLTSGGILLFEQLSTVDVMFHMKTTSNIIIPQGQAVALERVSATGAITCLVSLTKASS